MKFLVKLYYRWFGYNKLNKELSKSFETFDLSKSLEILKSNQEIVFKCKTLNDWLNLQHNVMNGQYKNALLKVLNESFLDTLKNDRNAFVREEFEENFTRYSYNIKFDSGRFQVRSLSNESIINFGIYDLSENAKNKSKTFFNWLFYQWKVKEFLDYHSDAVEECYKVINIYRTKEVIETPYRYLFVLMNLLYSDIEKKSIQSKNQFNSGHQNANTPYAFEEGRTFDFNIVDDLEIPETAKEALNLLSFIYSESWISRLNPQTEDSFNVNQILRVHIGRSIYNYLSMPAQFRDSMKNAEGLNMTELLFSNLDKYITLLTKIREAHTTSEAQQLLKKQSIQDKLVQNKIVKV